ncbi:Secretion protein HlyD [Thiobacillus denitrificans ATCC 25259]|uniref:Secretion protein HlyD n=1 Tax=Thiobacillus denitrificans (strain ATCC 25259 / T1) TaxID=292415 RepID=Q3SJ86_THIDA|nr:efflux RND transporter periplasmic adaptor subunit [Thiobacillus denitrificans]AAZ97281.1 Secretion protein HlyD [Thiobacillus denitrificans ATCC 25259]
MKFNPNKKQALVIAGVLAVGVLLAALVLGTGKPQMETDTHGEPAGQAEGGREDAGAPQKGPHGGKLFTQDGYGVEVTIFETNVEPQFRVYTYLNDKPLAPSASEVSLTLERLGRAPQVFRFTPENDYLKGDAVVEEPHSFKVGIAARHGGKSYRFGYEQVEARVAMSDQQVQQNKVEILSAGPARIQSVLELIGEIRFNEDRQVHVVPRLAGVVESVSANAGDRVRKGQVLAVIFSPALADQRSELLAAQKRLTLARSTFTREKKLWEDKISPEQDYLQAQAAMQEAEIAAQNARQKLASIGGELRGSGNLTRYEIRAPIGGVVIEKKVSLGETVKEDATIFVVADLSTVWAEMTIYAKDLNTVKVGQKATVKATAFESESSGVISYVGALVGEQTRTAKARVVLPNPQGVWRPGLPVSIRVVSGEVDVPVAVSAEAIQTVRGWTVVFGRYGDQFEARPVELGRSDGKFTEIISGLNAGEQYAAKNSFLIKADIGKSGASHDH